MYVVNTWFMLMSSVIYGINFLNGGLLLVFFIMLVFQTKYKIITHLQADTHFFT